MFRYIFTVCLASAFSTPGYSSTTGVPECETYPVACIFERAVKVTSLTDPQFSESGLPGLAFHSGRLGWGSIPGDLVAFLSERQRGKAGEFLSAGWSVYDGTAEFQLHRPLTALDDKMIAETRLADRVWNLSQNQILNILRASTLLPNVQGKILAEVLAKDLDRGNNRLAEGRYHFFKNYMGELRDPFLGMKGLSVNLAIQGYPNAARVIMADSEWPAGEREYSQLAQLIDVIEMSGDGAFGTAISKIVEMPSATSKVEALSYLLSMDNAPENTQVIVDHFHDALADLPEALKKEVLLKAISRVCHS